MVQYNYKSSASHTSPPTLNHSFSSVAQEPSQRSTQIPSAETLQTYRFNKYTIGVSIRLLFPLPLSSNSILQVRSIGDCINSPPGPRRIPRVKKALAEFEDTGILIRNGNHFRLTPSLQTVYVPRPLAPFLSDISTSLDEARLRHKVPVNAAPRRQMRELVSLRAMLPQT